MSTQQKRPLLEQVVWTGSSLHALVLQLGLLENEDAMRAQGLHGQSMHFWGCATARNCGQQGWELFQQRYPQHTISLVQQLIHSKKLHKKPGVPQFISKWFSTNPKDGLALLTYWENPAETLMHVGIAGVPPTLVEQAHHQRFVIEGLGLCESELQHFLVQYQHFFGSDLDQHATLALPDLQPG